MLSPVRKLPKMYKIEKPQCALRASTPTQKEEDMTTLCFELMPKIGRVTMRYSNRSDEDLRIKLTEEY